MKWKAAERRKILICPFKNIWEKKDGKKILEEKVAEISKNAKNCQNKLKLTAGK